MSIKPLCFPAEDRPVEAPANPQSSIPEEFERIKDISKRVKLCVSSIHRLKKLKLFPQTYMLGERARRFKKSEIDHFIATRIASNSPEVK
jgi:predicted DNA-binding transcriptional regulator AlpA